MGGIQVSKTGLHQIYIFNFIFLEWFDIFEF